MDRPARLEEHIELCRALWSGRPVDFDGRFHRYHGVTIQPTPVQDPCPIWISANPMPGRYWDRAMRRVARLADGVQTCALAPGYVGMVAGAVGSHLGEFGKSADGFPVSAYHNVNIGTDAEACLDESQRFLDAYYGPIFQPAQVRSWVSAGTPEEVVAHLRDIVEQGATHITLRMTSFDQDTQFRRLTEEVLPAL